ncbi:MAG: hypothetical protein O9257_05910 [Brevundimonas sp.]|jgi:hypothetical protein|nr:hypothetical protein [Brevundimonas sp.]
MIHPEVADEAVGLLLMLVADLGEEAASLAVTAPVDLTQRFARLRQLGEDQAVIAAAGKAVLRNRRPPAE